MVEVLDDDESDDLCASSVPPRGPRRGTYAYDCQSSDFNMAWASLEEFHVWLEKEQRTRAFELTRCRIKRSESIAPTYLELWIYRCPRGPTGGLKAYERKQPERATKVGTKKLDEGCPCTLIVKTYPDTPVVKGKYLDEHSHGVGDSNVRHTRVPLTTRTRVAEMLRMKIDKDHILNTLHEGAFSNPRGGHESAATREEFMTMRDIRRIEVAIEAETVRLAPEDGESTRQWAERLRQDDSLLSFKSCDDAVPEGSGLANDTFFIAFQTPWQREVFDEIGEFVLCMDGTHNTTMYENCTLFTLLSRDRWGHGVPVAFMLSSKKDTPTIAYFLRLFRKRNAKLSRYVMTDKDWAQINAIDSEFNGAIILLCWWHVLHAWQQHFHIADHPELWELLKRWIRFTDESEFDECWRNIQLIAPKTMVDYLSQYWIADKAMWSATARVNRGILEDIDTNMLVEAWHHVLKTKFLCGLRNRRCDQLLYTLVYIALPHYALKQRRQRFGFEGDDLEMQERRSALKGAESIKPIDITIIDTDRFSVKSQSTPTKDYVVDLSSWHCTCSYFPCANFCKHIFAVERFHPLVSSERCLTVENSLFPRPTAPVVTPSCSTLSAQPAFLSLLGPNTVATIDRLSVKVQTLLSRTTVTCPSAEVADLLRNLDQTIDILLEKTTDSSTRSVLPAPLKLPPHIRTATETAKTMPRLRGKRKRAVNGFSGNVGPNKDQGPMSEPDTAIAAKVQEKQEQALRSQEEAPSAVLPPASLPKRATKKARRSPLQPINNLQPTSRSSAAPEDATPAIAHPPFAYYHDGLVPSTSSVYPTYYSQYPQGPYTYPFHNPAYHPLNHSPDEEYNSMHLTSHVYPPYSSYPFAPLEQQPPST